MKNENKENDVLKISELVLEEYNYDAIRIKNQEYKDSFKLFIMDAYIIITKLLWGLDFNKNYLYMLPLDPKEKIIKIENNFNKWEKKSFDIAKILGGSKNQETTKKDLIAEAMLIFRDYTLQERLEKIKDISEPTNLTINDLLKNKNIKLRPYKKIIEVYYKKRK